MQFILNESFIWINSQSSPLEIYLVEHFRFLIKGSKDTLLSEFNVSYTWQSKIQKLTL